MTDRYRLEFLVKAGSWQEVVDMLKSELDITTEKQNASDRKISGMFIVQVWVDKTKIDSDFYSSVGKSSNIALSYDPSGKTTRDEILNRVCVVEHDLRNLLLNISDLVEDYIYDKTTIAVFFKNKRELIRNNDVNPITSYLTLDDEISIFSLELSPLKDKLLSADDLLAIFDKSSDINDIKELLRRKTVSRTVWDEVDRYILKSGEKWSDLLPKLNELRSIRNKAAHFRIVTQSDLSRAKTLSKEIDAVIKPTRKSTKQDLSELKRSLDQQSRILAELIRPMTESGLSASSFMVPNVQRALDALRNAIGAQPYQQAIANAALSSQTAKMALFQAVSQQQALQDLYKNLGVTDTDPQEGHK